MTSLRFSIDCSAPTNDDIFDAALFEKFLHDKIKVDGRTNQLAGVVTITRNGGIVTVESSKAMSKKYLKYLTKKFLKKHQLRDWLRVIAKSKESYQLKYFNIQNEEEEEEE